MLYSGSSSFPPAEVSRNSSAPAPIAGLTAPPSLYPKIQERVVGGTGTLRRGRRMRGLEKRRSASAAEQEHARSRAVGWLCEAGPIASHLVVVGYTSAPHFAAVGQKGTPGKNKTAEENSEESNVSAPPPSSGQNKWC